MIKSLESEISGLRAEELALKSVIINKDDDIYHEQLARCIGYAYPNEDKFVTIRNSSQQLILPNCQ